MTNFIPTFPLNIVVYPGEKLNLHIFEPGYKQLIKECHETKKPFGIPTVINNIMQDLGTMAEIIEICKVYENGEMDIKTKGVRVFRILELIKEIPDKLYSGAIVSYPFNKEKGKEELMRKVMTGIRELHKILKVDKDFQKVDELLTSFEVAHHIGPTIPVDVLAGLAAAEQALLITG